MIEPYHELAAAIVAQGIKDYYQSARKMVDLSISYLLGKDTGKDSRLFVRFENNRRVNQECSVFLLSEWYVALSETNGKAIKERLDAKVSAYGNERLFRETHKTISKNKRE